MGQKQKGVKNCEVLPATRKRLPPSFPSGIGCSEDPQEQKPTLFNICRIHENVERVELPGMAVYTCNPSILKAEAGGSTVQI